MGISNDGNSIVFTLIIVFCMITLFTRVVAQTNNCTVQVVSKGWYNYPDGNFYAKFYLDGVEVHMGASNGFNVAKVRRAADGSCFMSAVAVGLDMYANTTSASARLVDAMTSLSMGDIGVVGVSETGTNDNASPSPTTAAILSLQQTLGAQITSFSSMWRYSYVLIGRKGIASPRLCEHLPTNQILTCTITLVGAGMHASTELHLRSATTSVNNSKPFEKYSNFGNDGASSSKQLFTSQGLHNARSDPFSTGGENVHPSSSSSLQAQYKLTAGPTLANYNFEADPAAAHSTHYCPSSWTCSSSGSTLVTLYSDNTWGVGPGSPGCLLYYAGLQNAGNSIYQMFSVPQLTCVYVSFSARSRPTGPQGFVYPITGISISFDQVNVYYAAALSKSFSIYLSNTVCYTAAADVTITITSIPCSGDCTVEFDLIVLNSYDSPTFVPTVSPSLAPSAYPTTASPTVSQVLTDANALCAFKQGITNWPGTTSCIKSGWNCNGAGGTATTSACGAVAVTWSGVTCIGNAVNEVDLNGCGFQGTISSLISNLNLISAIYLSNNTFTGPIPTQISTLNSLNSLWVDSNMLTGPAGNFICSSSMTNAYKTVATPLQLQNNSFSCIDSCVQNISGSSIYYDASTPVCTDSPTASPSAKPTTAPTPKPTSEPTIAPTAAPTKEIPATEADALCAFKKGISNWPGTCSIPGWSCNGGTATSLPCKDINSSWYGVTCTSTSETISVGQLNLHSCGLRGTISSKLTTLTALNTLDLHNNKLTGAVGSFICQINDVNIDYNDFYCVDDCIDYHSSAEVTHSSNCGLTFSLFGNGVNSFLPVVCTLAFIFACILIWAMYLSRSVRIIILIFLPFLDVFSDLLYLTTSEFFTISLFVLCVFFYLLPCAFFMYEIIFDEKISPRQPLYKKFPLQGNVWWLSSRGGIPLINGLRPSYFNYEEFDSIIKMLLAAVVWLYLAILQLLKFLAFCLWTTVLDPPMVLWTVLGIFLYQTKLLSITPFWNMWVKRWAGDVNHEKYLKKGMLDVKVLNKSLFYEFAFETTPQIIIQFANNELMRNISEIGYFSIAMSILFAIDGLYSFGFYLYYKKMSFENVPTLIVIPPELLAEYVGANSDKQANDDNLEVKNSMWSMSVDSSDPASS